jgi:hypothetical protein
MSLEHFPCNEIPFEDLLDGRLERFGISTDAGDEIAALIAPDGTATILLRTAKGYAQFPRKVPVVVRNAIAAEFDTDLPEGDDFSHVVVEGPSCGDAEFICQWLNAALESDRLLDQHSTKDPPFWNSMLRLEMESLIEFAPAATAFIRKWLKNRRSFSLNLRDSPWVGIFTVMVGIGFFTRTGNRYQMTVPHRVELGSITESLLQLAETEDAEYYLHPERHLVAMTSYQAKHLRARLSGSDEETRLADREKLLAENKVLAHPSAFSNYTVRFANYWTENFVMRDSAALVRDRLRSIYERHSATEPATAASSESNG